jgi:peptidoglycan hydrolase-like protein with peptidoglycan-binding domain
MAKRKFKNIKDFGNPRKSERRKYLETMMADMGLTSLSELSPEERRRWLKAARPSPMVEKKLREMGYSIHSNRNKRSLGSKERSGNILGLHKVANLSAASADVTVALREFISLLKRKTIHDISKFQRIISSEILQDKDFDSNKLKAELETFLADNEEDVVFLKFYIENLVQKASKYNSEYLKSTGVFDRADYGTLEEIMLSDQNLEIKIGHSDRDKVALIQQLLESLGYTLQIYGVDGKFESETENAVILFQQQNSLPVTGTVNAQTFNKLITDPKPLPVESRREHKRMLRQEQRGQGARSDAPRYHGNLQNIDLVYSGVDLDNASSMLSEYLVILDETASELGGRIKITSAFRDSYSQARIMYNNYKSRGVGSSRANSYLSRLYVRFPRISEIVNIYSGSRNKEDKIKAVEEIVETSWPKGGHRGGKSIDIRFGNKVKDILIETQNLATVDILQESDHFHVTIKSLNPGGIPSGHVRRFS